MIAQNQQLLFENIHRGDIVTILIKKGEQVDWTSGNIICKTMRLTGRAVLCRDSRWLLDCNGLPALASPLNVIAVKPSYYATH